MFLITENVTEKQQLTARNHNKNSTILLRDCNQEKIKNDESKKC